jgi:hypothetical protein
MLSQVSERRMHLVRWALTLGWLLLIFSLLCPWSAHWFTATTAEKPCIQIQQQCFAHQVTPLGTTLFWNIVVPGAIFILFIFGHEAWRRICPLSFLSQLPRALGWQRKVQKQTDTGRTRTELIKIAPNSWLGRNYPYVQFGWLFVGLCGRLLWFNADRLLLALWLLLTITVAIAVGYCFPGKSWCNYFCPMAPVQRVFSEPGGLLGSAGHIGDRTITQSMCRTTLPDGQEDSACVACQTPCIDIDAERSYWEHLQHPTQAFLYYSYVGLLVGFFVYFYLYAGNWDYYFSGIWAQPLKWQQPAAGLFFLNVPQWIAVPTVLGTCSAAGYGIGHGLEALIRTYSDRNHLNLGLEHIRHQLFTLCTYFSFNFFFLFAGRSLIQQLPEAVITIYDFSLVLFSTLWLTKVWPRSSELHSQEGLASRFRTKLVKMGLDLQKALAGKSINDLNPQAVIVLAKVLPEFGKEKRFQIYKDVLREALEEGYTGFVGSLEKLRQLRQELGLTDDEHQEILDALQVEDPDLRRQEHQRNLEDQVRINGYRRALERMTQLQLQDNTATLRKLRRKFSITAEEEEWIASGLDPEADQLRRSHYLIGQLSDLIQRYRALKPVLKDHSIALSFLWETLHYKQFLLVHQLLENLVSLDKSPTALPLAQKLGQLSAWVVLEALGEEDWRERLTPEIFAALTTPIASETPQYCELYPPEAEVINHFEAFLEEPNPLLQMVCLYLIAQIDLPRSQEKARELQKSPHPEVQTLAGQILQQSATAPTLDKFPTLEVLVYLYNSDFFHWMRSGTLLSLAKQAEIRSYQVGELVTEVGDTCRELLLLVQGEAEVQFKLTTGEIRTQSLKTGQVIDELDVLARRDRLGTVMAQSPLTRILAVPVDAFDAFVAGDPDFARRVVELESRQLQEFIQDFSRHQAES